MENNDSNAQQIAKVPVLLSKKNGREVSKNRVPAIRWTT